MPEVCGPSEERLQMSEEQIWLLDPWPVGSLETHADLGGMTPHDGRSSGRYLTTAEWGPSVSGPACQPKLPFQKPLLSAA